MAASRETEGSPPEHPPIMNSPPGNQTGIELEQGFFLHLPTGRTSEPLEPMQRTISLRTAQNVIQAPDQSIRMSELNIVFALCHNVKPCLTDRNRAGMIAR